MERQMAEQKSLREGGGTRANLLEAGAHLWLAEELRAAASLLSDGAADPRVAAEQLEEICMYVCDYASIVDEYAEEMKNKAKAEREIDYMNWLKDD